LYTGEGANLTANNLTSVRGDLYTGEGANLTANNLTSVGGRLYMRKGATLTANALTTVGGDLFMFEGATLTVNALTTAYGQPGRELTRCTVSGHVLWLGNNGLYYAGRCVGLTREQALDHWSTGTARTKLFTAAILNTTI
jgi:hypothetical protein